MLQFVKYYEAHKIVPLCLPPYSTHILQPLDVSIFRPLARAYKKRLYDIALYGALAITKQEFLEIYQAARSQAISLTNIASAWRATGLIPHDPSAVLSKIQPETPPFASLTNKNGVRINIPMSPSVREKINKVINSVIQGATPLRSKALLNLQQIALRTLANKTILQRINMELIKKQKRQRRGQGKTLYSKARVLLVREAL